MTAKHMRGWRWSGREMRKQSSPSGMGLGWAWAAG
eukprot:CAMPEP_0181181698 /NCGR_PEP_ID=MMETSP1096-20121128/7478_1 /TAXON_ID=156174 ORGANISM="Chrysochromulina ericina, Strain CCMP281" /NCGR_SAMPLE_ID=MMETSP1096 /ASSEMBLY_ACC=CAM_ASM_000453 /LENGTH=34 /DNA_ID= /DNA_START= /DNA_END= /DNA_ORIENTATION=